MHCAFLVNVTSQTAVVLLAALSQIHLLDAVGGSRPGRRVPPAARAK